VARTAMATSGSCGGRHPGRAGEDLAERDGAFVACQTDRGATLKRLLEPLVPSLVASRRALLAGS